MDSATEDLHLQKLEEYIHDENKIVTVPWISNALHINVTLARQLLSTFVEDRRGQNAGDLALTYTLSGELVDGKGLAVMLVDEASMKKKKVLFKKVHSEELYSVQKNKNVDLDILSLVDALDVNFPREKPLAGSIVGEDCVKCERKVKSLALIRPEQKSKSKLPTKPSTTAEAKSNATEEIESKKSSKSDATKETTSIKQSATSAKQQKAAKGGIANFFSKGQDKPRENKPQQSTENTDRDEESKPVVEKAASKKGEGENKSIEISDSDDGKVGEMKSQETSGSTSSSKKRQRKKKPTDSAAKKRRRIVIHDSDSDDLFGSAEDKEPEAKPESEEEEEAIVEAKPLVKVDWDAPKNKRRKLVNKTYTDEEGYVLTKKEWVYESCSDDENEQNAQNSQAKRKTAESPKSAPIKKTGSAPESEKNSSGKGKGMKGNKKGSKASSGSQPTLMNFFKKH